MTWRTLILLRHAKSDWSADEADIARSSARRGRRQAPAAGRWLAANIDRIDLAAVSPASRARSTWDLVSARMDVPPRTRIDDRVYAASGQELLTVVRELSDDVEGVVLVGHNPGIEDLVSLLTGEWAPMHTSAFEVRSRYRARGRPRVIIQQCCGRPASQRDQLPLISTPPAA